jgi:hypothetical protein
MAVVFISLMVWSGGVLWGRGRFQPAECSGRVVDGDGRPVADAEVVCAEQLHDYAAGRIDWGTPSRATTDQDGRFRVQVSAERRDDIWVVAWKKGLSLGWQRLRSVPSGEDLSIRLTEPTVLAGVVVDEADKPVAGALVRPCLKMEGIAGSMGTSFNEPREWFSAWTDNRGRFRFEHIPARATADFWVEAPGMASCWTHWPSDLEGSQFKAGRTDIRIVLKPEAIIRGRVIDEDSGTGVAGVHLLARPNARYASYSCVDPITSGHDGDFVYRGLPADDYSLQIVAPQDRMADWTGKDVKVTVVEGQTVDVDISVGKGALIEVTVLDAVTARPIENAVVRVSQEAGFGLHPCWYHSLQTNAEGLARLRVPPGESRVRMWADAYDYISDPEPVIAAKGEVIRREARLDPFPSVAGTVRDSNGHPAAGAIVSSKPICEQPVQTDEQGRFKVQWRPSPSVRNVLVLARDPDRNLAGLADVKDPSQPVDVTLTSAFTVRGRITDPNGRAISMATVSLLASMPGWLTDAASAVFTDSNGVYETRAIPAPTEGFRYQIEVQAQGYGPTRLSELPFGAAQDRQVEVAPITLPIADKSISGVVVDANGAPAPGLPVFIDGPRGSRTAGQPSHRTVTDEQGRFAVEGVCAGPLRIQASFSSSPGGMGMLDAQGGDRDVKVVLGRSGVHVELKSLLGKPLPDMKGLIDLPLEQTQDKSVLLCFFDMEQRPSRHCIANLVKQVDTLGEKGVVVAAIQAASVDEEAWKTWAAQYHSRLPLGQIKEDMEKVRSNWGVQSLPWLILTDARHNVRAEGFALAEIDGMIAGMR